MIFSILAFITLVISICIKERKKALEIQSINCLCEALYALTISAFTGAVLGVVNFIRTFLFINKGKFSNKSYVLILAIFETIIIVNCIYTWAGLISLLPTIGSIIRTYCLWQSDMKFVRFSGITTGISYGTYYIYYGGWFMVLGYFVVLITGVWAVYKNDVKRIV